MGFDSSFTDEGDAGTLTLASCAPNTPESRHPVLMHILEKYGNRRVLALHCMGILAFQVLAGAHAIDELE